MREKLRKLRAELKLSQAAFGAKLGLGQRAIADVEIGRNKLTERNFENICRVFNVNPEWLRTGEGEMFMPTVEKTPLDLFVEEKNLTATDRAFIETFANLPQESRAIIANWFNTFSDNAKLK